MDQKKKLAENEKNGIMQAWACGGGVQSAAIAALIYTEKIQKPDYAWMIDCGWEKTKTMEYVVSVLTPKMAEVGVTLNIIKTTDYTDNSLFDKSGNPVLPLFVKKPDGTRIKYTIPHCSGPWKNQVANRWLRSQGVKRCDTWIGISVDEAKRAKKGRLKWNKNRYPLLEMGIRREDCIDYIARLGWPKPEHSACLVCPNQNDWQWMDLKANYPDDWQMAVEADELMRDENPNLFLHGSCEPLRHVTFGEWGGGLKSPGT